MGIVGLHDFDCSATITNPDYQRRPPLNLEVLGGHWILITLLFNSSFHSFSNSNIP